MLNKAPILFKCAHLSDLHFSKLKFSFRELFSKSSIGNLNLLIHRRYEFKNEIPFSLIDHLKKEQISHVFITGDLSKTSSKEEFELANLFIKALCDEKIKVMLIPGNHDNYTKASSKEQRFYATFEDSEPGLLGLSLKNDKICAHYLGDHFWVVRIDSTHHTPVYLSTGYYTKRHDENLKKVLSEIPKTDHVIIMNHFPLFNHESARRRMNGSEMLRKTLSHYPQVKLYLHGHTHKQNISDLRKNHLPIVADSGSLSHVTNSSWNLFELFPSSCSVSIYKKTAPKTWNRLKNFTYPWNYE